MKQLAVLIAVAALAGCASGAPRSWSKPGATAEATQRAQYECMRDSRVGNVVPSDEQRAFFYGSNKLAQNDANRLYTACMESRGWSPDR